MGRLKTPSPFGDAALDRHELGFGTPQGAISGILFDMPRVQTMEVALGSPRFEDVQGFFGAFTVSGINTRTRRFGGVVVTGDVSSAFERDFDDVLVTVVFYRDGVVVGGLCGTNIRSCRFPLW